MEKITLKELAKVELQHIRFKLHCQCGKDFIAEDFEPECPYCNKNYSIKMFGDGNEVKISMLR